MRIVKALAAVLLAPALAFGSLAAAGGAVLAAEPGPAGTQHIVRDSTRQTVIDIFDGINAFRAGKGLPPVKFNAAISAAVSQKWSDAMAAGDFFRHNADYVSGAPAAGLAAAGENIAARWDRSGAELVRQWIASPAHNANMSNPRWDYVAIGVTYTDGDWRSAPQRYATYAVTNFFDYRAGTVPAGSYDHPRDFFARPASVKPAPPAFAKAARKVTIPATAGVRYYLDGKAVKAGTYKTGRPAGTVAAKAAAGRTLTGSTKWSYDFRTTVRAAKPAFDKRKNRYTLPKQAGVRYYVDGRAKAPGRHGVRNGQKLGFTAKASSSWYRLSGSRSWSYRF